MNKIVFLLYLSISLSSSIHFFGQSDINDVHETIDSLVQATKEKNDIPSMVIGVIQNGEVTFQKGYGVLERGAAIEVDEKTSYQIASLSKMFTGIIANSLIIEGKLQTDESISAYLPEELSDKHREKLESITIKDLLLHRSGIQRDSKSYKRKDGEPMDSPYTKTDLIRDLEKVKTRRKGRYSYSNVGYAILGTILENVSGLSYEELLKKYVTNQYSLSNTSIHSSTPTATPYHKDDRLTQTKPWNTGLLTPASGIYSNVDDLTKLMTEQLKIYRMSNDETMLNSPLYLTKEKDFRGDGESYYGMGLWEFEFDRGVLFGHSGDMDGYASQYRFNKTTNTGVVILTSSGGDWTSKLIAEVSKIIEEHTLKTGYNKG